MHDNPYLDIRYPVTHPIYQSDPPVMQFLVRQIGHFHHIREILIRGLPNQGNPGRVFSSQIEKFVTLVEFWESTGLIGSREGVPLGLDLDRTVLEWHVLALDHVHFQPALRLVAGFVLLA